MADARMRTIERLAAQGDPEATARLWRDRVRAGAVDPLPWWVGDRDWLVVSTHSHTGTFQVIAAFYVVEKADIYAQKQSERSISHHEWVTMRRAEWPRPSNGREKG